MACFSLARVYARHRRPLVAPTELPAGTFTTCRLGLRCSSSPAVARGVRTTDGAPELPRSRQDPSSSYSGTIVLRRRSEADGAAVPTANGHATRAYARVTNARGELTANQFPAPASEPGGVDGRSNRRQYRERPQAGVDSEAMVDAKPHWATCLAYADHLSTSIVRLRPSVVETERDYVYCGCSVQGKPLILRANCFTSALALACPPTPSVISTVCTYEPEGHERR